MSLAEMIDMIRLLIKYGAVVEENEDKQDDIFAVARAALDRMKMTWGSGNVTENVNDIPF